jgi:hypothetical protein
MSRDSLKEYGVVWWFGTRVDEVPSKSFRLVGGVGAILNVSSLVRVSDDWSVEQSAESSSTT